MTGTYTAVEVSEPGKLQVVQRPLPNPVAGQVLIHVEACGVCHTDAATVTGTYPGLTLPRVPGHEVVGRIDALGSSVSRANLLVQSAHVQPANNFLANHRASLARCGPSTSDPATAPSNSTTSARAVAFGSFTPAAFVHSRKRSMNHSR